MTLTEKDLDDIELRLKDTFATKQELQEFKSQALGKLDQILSEILASREEETVLAHRVTRIEQQIKAV